MGFWKNIFSRKKSRKPQEESWEQLEYVRDQVNFVDGEQRRRYITGCLEQIAEASKEVNLLTGEYALVTTYLTDMEEIEALPPEEREEVDRIAGKLLLLDRERKVYRSKKNRMSDSEYNALRRQEDQIEEGIRKLEEGENYRNLIRQDLQRLNGERHAYEFRRTELENLMNNQRGMSVIFLIALCVCVLMLVILQFAFAMNTRAGYFVSVTAAAVALTVLCVKYMDASRECARVERAVNRLIQLQNTVKIRYVNNTRLLEYYYMKYNTDSSARLRQRWELYQREKEERKQFAEAEAKLDYYMEALKKQLSRFRVSDPGRWTSQPGALLDKREMVEIRHNLILRRQALREQMDYNRSLAETAHNEIMSVAEEYPDYAREIMAMVDQYES